MRKLFTLFLFFMLLCFYGNSQKQLILCTTGRGLDNSSPIGIDTEMWNYIQKWVNLAPNGQDAGVTAVRLHVEWKQYEPTLGNYQGAKLVAALQAIKNLKPNMKLALHFSYLRSGASGDSYLADEDMARLADGSLMKDDVGHTVPSVYSETTKTRFINMVHNAMTAVSSFYNDILYVQMGNSEAEEFIIPIKDKNGYHHSGFYEEKALAAWRSQYLPCRYPGMDSVTWQGNKYKIADAPPYNPGQYGDYNGEHGREYHRFASWGLIRFYKQFRDAVKSHSNNIKVLYFIPGLGTSQSNIRSLHSASIPAAYNEFDGIYCSEGSHTGDTWRKIMALDVFKGTNANKIAAIEFDPTDLGQGQGGLWPNMVTDWFARAYKHGADYIHIAMHFWDHEIDQIAPAIAGIKSTYVTPNYQPPARQNPVTKNIYPAVFTGAFLFDDTWRDQLHGDVWSTTDNSPISINMSDAGYWENINSCTPVNTCDYNISASGPSSVNTGASITLNSTISGQSSGVSYSWSGTGISGSNTNASVTFLAPSTTGTYTYTLTTSKSGCSNKTATVSVNVTTSGGGGGAYTQAFDNFFNDRLNSSYNGQVTAIVGCGDNILYTYNRGFALDQKLNIMSLTKWTTAAIIMMLEKENKLKLTDTVGKYLPLWNQYGKGHITIEQLLSHTSGLPVDTEHDERSDINLKTAVDYIAMYFGLPYAGQFKYGSTSYKVAARIAEIVEGSNGVDKPWKTIFAERLANVSGMPNARYRYQIPYSEDNPACGYGLEVSSYEYANFLKMILRYGWFNGTQVMDSSSVAEIEKKHNMYGEYENYGLGVQRDNYPNSTQLRQAWHEGASGTFAFLNREKKYYALVFGQNGGAASLASRDFKNLVDQQLAANTCGIVNPTPCEYPISIAGPTENVGTGTSVTLSSNCTAQCSGVSYLWAGTGINGSNTGASVTFNAPTTAGAYDYTLTTSKSGCTNRTKTFRVHVGSTSGGGGTGCVVNKVKLQFRTTGGCCMERLPGAKIQGSNNGSTWIDLYTFTANGTGNMDEFTFPNTTAYSSVRFVASATGWGELHELEFYNGNTKLSGTPFGTDNYSLAFDGNASTQWHAPTTPGTNNYAGLNLTGCTPTNCDFNVTASASPSSVNVSGTVALSYNCTGTDCSGATFAWSGQGISGNQSPNNITAPATAGTYTYTITATKSGCTTKSANVNVTVNQPSGGTGCVVNKVKLQFREPGQCCMERLPGAKIQGSNNGSTWIDLYTFTANGTGNMDEFTFPNTTAYSSVRFVASATGWGELHELEFYNGSTKLSGTPFGTDNYSLAFDGNSSTQWHAPTTPGTNNYAGLNLTGCTPTNCDFNVTASASPSSVNVSGTVALSYNCTGTDCSGATFAWSGQGISGNQSPNNITAPATAGTYTYTITATKSGCTTKSANVNVTVTQPSGGSGCIVNKVKLKFRQPNECCMDRLQGAKIQGSNNGSTWTDLYTFTANGTGNMDEFTIPNTTAYSSVRFQASSTGWGELYELEFYKGSAKLTGTPFGIGNYANAFDGNLSTDWQVSSNPGTGNHAGLSNLGNCSGSAVVLDADDPGSINKLQLSVSPNPSKGVINAGFYLPRGEKATIVINDLQGRNIYQRVVTGNGQHNEKIYLMNKASGMFLLRLQTSKGVEVRKVNIAR